MEEHLLGHRTKEDDMPWYVRAIFLMGVPSSIAIYLVYVLVNTITPVLLSLQLSMGSVIQTLDQRGKEHIISETQNENILRVLRVSCANQALTIEARNRCY